MGRDVIMTERTREPVKARAGIGYAFVEAPRGLLYHSYEINEKGIIKSEHSGPDDLQPQEYRE